MKIEVSQADLIKAVNIVSKAVPVRTSMPILESILIDASGNEIKLIANNMELGIKTTVGGKIHEKGIVAIDAKFLTDLVRKIPQNIVTIETDDSFHTTISCEKMVIKVMGKSGEDFPAIPAVSRNEPVVISQLSLRDIIRQTTFSLAQNDNNKMMTGELFDIHENVLKAVTLDGNRISIRFLELSGEAPDNRVVIPGKTLNEIAKILDGGADDLINIFITDNHVIFEFETTTIVSRLIEGDYFQIEHMISNDYETKVTVNKQDFFNTIDRTTIMAKEGDKKPIVFRISDDNFNISIDSAYGSMNEDIDANKEGKDIIIGFNPKYLIDALKVIDDDEITMYMLNSKSPCIIRDEDNTYSYIILPINISSSI